MSVELLNHENSPVWSDIYKKDTGAPKFNGAAAYSKLITDEYWPIFKRISREDEPLRVKVITVTTESKPQTIPGDVLIVFLHEIQDPKGNPTIYRQKAFCKANPGKRIVFITWNEDWKKMIEANGMEAIWLPSAIDVKTLKKQAGRVKYRYPRRVIWFGNLRAQKLRSWYLMKAACRKYNWGIDLISGGKFNQSGGYLSREETIKKVARYQYGVGVGLCAQEMAALGLKVFCFSYGDKGYLPMTQKEAEFAVLHNMYCKGYEEVKPEQAILNFPQVAVCPVNDVEKCQRMLIKGLMEKGLFPNSGAEITGLKNQ